MTFERDPEWFETDCFWCGAVYNPSVDVCPRCASDILTGPIEIVNFNNDGEPYDYEQ